MIHFVVTLKGRTLNRFSVEGDRVRIGRLPENEVQIDNSSVSRLHCVLERDGEGWWLTDQGSFNGTFLNGAKVQSRCQVRSGSTLSVGQFLVSLEVDEEGLLSSSSSGKFAPRIAVRASRDPETRQALATEKGYLLRTNSPGPPVVLSRDVAQIGGAPGLEVALPGPHTSALIVRGYGGFQLVRASEVEVSRRGTPVANSVWLEDNDAFTVGSLGFTFHLGLPMGDDDQSTIQMQIPEGGFGTL